jgi:hypothetical protein
MSPARKRLILVAGILLLLSLVLVLTNCNRPGSGQGEAEEKIVCGYVDPPIPAPGMRALTAYVPEPAIGSRRILVVNGSTSPIALDVAPFWQAASYGLTTFLIDSISASFSTPCSLTEMVPLAVAALDDRVDFRLYKHIVVVASTSGCSYGGIGWLFRDLATNDGVLTIGFARWGESASPRTMRHEFGHTFGLTHARSWPCKGIPAGGLASCGTPGEYGGYGIMGGGSAGVEGQMREWLGWVQAQEITAPGTYTLAALTLSSGTRLLKMARTAYDSLYLEYTSSAGIRLHTEWTQISGGPDLSTAFPLEVQAGDTYRTLGVGETRIDEGTAARVTVTALTSTEATVAVEPGTPDITTPTCSPALEIPPPANGSTVSGTVTLAAEISDDRAYQLRVRVGGNAESLLFDREAPYSITWDTTKFPNGYAPISAFAYDYVGNQAFCWNAGVTISNSGPTSTPLAPTVTRTPTSGAPTPTSVVGTPTRTPTKRIPPGLLKKTKTARAP